MEPVVGPDLERERTTTLTLSTIRLVDLFRPWFRVKAWTRHRLADARDLGRHALIHPITIVVYAMLVGAVLRGARIGTLPPGVNQDEAVAGYDAWSLAHTLRDHHGDGLNLIGLLSFGDWVSPFLTFFMIPFVGLLGLDIVSVRVATVVLGITAIPLTYLLTVELTGRRTTAAAAACFLAVSPWAVHMSRFAIPPATVVPLLALSLWLILRALRLRTTWSLVLAGAATGCLVLGYPTMKLYAPIVVGLVALLYIRSINRIPLLRLLIGLLVLAAIVAPTYLFFFLDPAAQNRQQYVSVFNRPEFGLDLLLREYWAYLSPNYLYERAPVTDYIRGEAFNAEPGYGVELVWTAPFLVLGLLAVVVRAVDLRRRWSIRRSAVLLAGLIVLSPLTGAVTYQFNSSRNAQLALFVSIVAGIGLMTLVDVLMRALRWPNDRHVRPGRVRRAALIVMMGLSLVPATVEAQSQYRGYFQKWPDEFMTQYYYHAGLMDAFSYARGVEDDYDEIWVTATNQGYIFLLFFDRIDPVLVHADLRTTTNSFAGYHVEQFGIYHFTRPYFGPPEELDLDDVNIVHESFPSGSGRGYIVWNITIGDRRILVIQDRVR